MKNTDAHITAEHMGDIVATRSRYGIPTSAETLRNFGFSEAQLRAAAPLALNLASARLCGRSITIIAELDEIERGEALVRKMGRMMMADFDVNEPGFSPSNIEAVKQIFEEEQKQKKPNPAVITACEAYLRAAGEHWEGRRDFIGATHPGD